MGRGDEAAGSVEGGCHLYFMDGHRQADLQDLMGEDEYLPSKEELGLLRSEIQKELSHMTKKKVTSRPEAVKARRLVTAAILLDNFQRSGAIENATINEYEQRKHGIIRVKEHKSRASYGSANLVITEIEDFVDYYVENARPLLSKEKNISSLFPSSDPWDDLGKACDMFGVKRFSPTSLRKAASTAAYSDLSELERKNVANHMTHRPETAFKAYAVKNRRADTKESVSTMKGVMYGEEREHVSARAPDIESTIPSSAGALHRRTRESFHLSRLRQ